MKQKLVQILKQFSKKKGAVAPCGEILEPLIEQTQNQSNQINKAVESNVSKKKTFLIPQIALMYQRKARLFYLDNRELTNF